MVAELRGLDLLQEFQVLQQSLLGLTQKVQATQQWLCQTVLLLWAILGYCRRRKLLVWPLTALIQNVS
jgi:hypothetical protein